LDFKQLEAYVQVVELKSFSKAAESIYVSQPSVSAYINALEQELEIQLIFRSTKEVLVTKAGSLFYEYAKNILTLRDTSILQVKKLFECTSGEICILASSVPSQYILPEILPEFHKEYPNISFNIIQTDSADVIKCIESQGFEFGFVGAKIETSKCYYEHVLSDKIVIITPNSEKYRNIINSSSLNFLYNESFIVREKGSGTRLKYEELIENLGLDIRKLRVGATFSNTQSIIHAVSKGLGFSIVSYLSAEFYIKQNLVLSIDIETPLSQRDFYFVFKKNFMISPLSQVFINFAYAYFQNTQQINSA